MNKSTILVVEDEALIAANLVNTLTSLGYTVPEPVATGEDAIRAVKIQKPDLVLMDIVLIGEMDGIVAAEKIRAIADIPVIYLTAYTDDLHLKQAQLTEPYGYIVKPAHSSELNATIGMALYKHALDRKLKESEERYRTLFGTIIEGVVLIAPDGQIVNANPAAEHILGLTRSEIEGRQYDSPDWEILSFDGTPMLPEEMAGPRAMREKRSVKDVVMGARRPDGFISWIHVNAAPLLDEAGNLKGVVGTFDDITERRKVEEALRETEERYKSLFERSLDCVYINDFKGNFIDANQSALTLLGYTRNEITSLNFVSLLTPDQLSTALKANQEILTTGTQQKPTEYRVRRKDGGYVDLMTTASLIYQNGKPYAVQGIAHDITERKRIGEALKDSEERLNLAVDSASLGVWDMNFRGDGS
jgi:PAS domain S-box-containing protein